MLSKITNRDHNFEKWWAELPRGEGLGHRDLGKVVSQYDADFGHSLQ